MKEDPERVGSVFQCGDRIQETFWGAVGTVDRVYQVAGIDVIDVLWDRSNFRMDDPDIRLFDEEAEQARIDQAIARHRSTEVVG